MLLQTYSPFEDRLIPLFFYYVIIAAFSIVITVRVFLKWRERKAKPTLDLTLLFVVLTAAIIIVMLGFLEAYLTGFFKEFYRLSLPLGYTCIVVADIILYMFATDITKKGKKAIIPVSLISIVLVVVLFLPWNFWGIPDTEYSDDLSIRLYSMLGLVTFSYVVYISIAVVCNNAKKNAKDPVAKFGLGLLVYSMICLILFFLMFIFDTILITMFDHNGYSEFIWVAWIFAVLFYILMYMSVVMPEWLKKRIKKE